MEYPDYIYESADSWGEPFFFTEKNRKEIIKVFAECFGVSAEELAEDYCAEYEFVKALDNEQALYRATRDRDDYFVIVEESDNPIMLDLVEQDVDLEDFSGGLNKTKYTVSCIKDRQFNSLEAAKKRLKKAVLDERWTEILMGREATWTPPNWCIYDEDGEVVAWAEDVLWD